MERGSIGGYGILCLRWNRFDRALQAFFDRGRSKNRAGSCRMNCNQFLAPSTRRAMLINTACGFGQVALSGLLAGSEPASRVAGKEGLTPLPHFLPRAKRAIFLFMWGGPSHVDTFDPKPRLNEDDGKPISPQSVATDKSSLGNASVPPFDLLNMAKGVSGSASCFRIWPRSQTAYV